MRRVKKLRKCEAGKRLMSEKHLSLLHIPSTLRYTNMYTYKVYFTCAKNSLPSVCREMLMVRVHPHARKHGLSDEEVAYAWEEAIRSRQRNGTDDPPLWIAIGVLPDGRLAELVGFLDEDGVWCVFHAKTPPTKKFKKELGFSRGRL